MCTFFCFVEFVLCTSCNNIFLMSQIMLEHLQKIQNFRLFVYQCKHGHTKGILQLCMFIQLIQNYIRIGIFTKIDTDTHTFTAWFICDRCDSVNLFITYQFCHFFDQSGLVYHIRQLRYQNTALAVWHGFDFCYGTHTDLAASCAVSFLDSSCSEDHCTGREIRTFYDIQDFFDLRLSAFFNAVVDDLHNGFYNFTQIMRRNVRCHTYGDTGRTIYQKIRKSCRKYIWLFLRFIEVRWKIYRIFIDICKHFHGNFAQTCLSISHGSSSVAIDRTKVSVAVYQRISGWPVLSHIYQCSVDGAVSMWMIFTHGITDNTCTFTVRLVRSVIQFDHGIQNSSLHRLQTVSYIRQCTCCNNAHCIIDIRFFHGLFQIHVMYLIKNIVFQQFFLLLPSTKYPDFLQTEHSLQ